jgi:hypothetical protein
MIRDFHENQSSELPIFFFLFTFFLRPSLRPPIPAGASSPAEVQILHGARGRAQGAGRDELVHARGLVRRRESRRRRAGAFISECALNSQRDKKWQIFQEPFIDCNTNTQYSSRVSAKHNHCFDMSHAETSVIVSTRLSHPIVCLVPFSASAHSATSTRSTSTNSRAASASRSSSTATPRNRARRPCSRNCSRYVRACRQCWQCERNVQCVCACWQC